MLAMTARIKGRSAAASRAIVLLDESAVSTAALGMGDLRESPARGNEKSASNIV